jgi:hypothetical protein
MGNLNKTVSLKPRHIEYIDKKPLSWKLSQFLQKKLDEDQNKISKKRLVKLLKKYNDNLMNDVTPGKLPSSEDYYEYVATALMQILDIYEKPNITQFCKKGEVKTNA